MLLYVHRNRRLIRDGRPGRPPRLSHSAWALISLDRSCGCVLLYVRRNRRLIRDGRPGWPPRLSHSSWAVSLVEKSMDLHIRHNISKALENISVLRICVKIEVAFLGSRSLISMTVSVYVKQHRNEKNNNWRISVRPGAGKPSVSGRFWRRRLAIRGGGLIVGLQTSNVSHPGTWLLLARWCDMQENNITGAGRSVARGTRSS